MKTCALIWTWNDAIDRSVQGLMVQSHPVDEILIVDNGSSDGTLSGPFPDKVTVIRSNRNLGACGAANLGLKYALEKGYDWVWTLDADSVPPPDGLEKLLGLYDSFSAEQQSQVRVIACLPKDKLSPRCHHGSIFTPFGFEHVDPDPGLEFYECDVTIWSGSLFRMAAAREVGLPRPEYWMDWGEYEYGYRGKKMGYRAFVHQGCILDHNIGERVSEEEEPKNREGRIGPLSFSLRLMTPIRLYSIYRNMTYFFLYEYFEGNVFRFLRYALWMPRHVVKLILVGQVGRELGACALGLFDGLRKNMGRQF